MAELWGLFAGSFLAATLLPGGSEALLLWLQAAGTHAPWTLAAVATAGNTLGGMSSWLLGRLAARIVRPSAPGGGKARAWAAESAPASSPSPAQRGRAGEGASETVSAASPSPAQRGRAGEGAGSPPPWATERVRRHGAAVLLLSWLPVAGDALCLAAGWLGVRALPALAFIAAGKAARYAALLAIAP